MTASDFKAGYLPGIADADVTWHRVNMGSPDAPLRVDMPLISAGQMAALAGRIRCASQAHLKTMQVSEIVRVLDVATARLLDQGDVYRQALERLLPLATGFASEMVRLNLNAYLHTFRALQLQRFVVEDFPNPKLLDEFQPRVKGGWSKAYGPDLLLHVWAGNVPALSLWSFVSGLLVKAGSIGKVSSAEPLFASLYARLLVDIEPRWSDCFAVVWWPSGGASHAEQHAFGLADVVTAYGGNAALQAMQANVPVTTRFLAHGHKLSFGVVSASALCAGTGPQLAHQLALDVARYDQQGCYSPHMVYVQRGGMVSPLEFAQYLTSSLAAVSHKLPQRALSLEEAGQVSAWCNAYELEAVTNAHVTVMGGHAVWGTVVFSERSLPLCPGPLNRRVLVVAVDSLDDVAALVEQQRDFLQTAGVAASPEELLVLSDGLGRAGVTRVCALGAMTQPAAGWHHDGRFSLLDLVRMVDVEDSAERSGEQFTRYEI